MAKPSFTRLLARAASPALLGILAVTLLAEPASAAWTVQCLWNGIPTADRSALVAGTSRNRAPGLDAAKIKTAAAACGVTAEQSADAQKALSAYGLGLAAMASLEKRHRVTQAQVLSAWTALPNDDRASFVAIARTMRNDPQKVALLNRVVTQMALRLSLTAETAPELKQIVYSLALLQSLGRGGIRG